MTAVPTEAITVAARAYCLLRFSYDGAYQADADREAHIAADASSTAAEPWLAAVLEAAAPLIAAQAAAAERERIRQLAIRSHAIYLTANCMQCAGSETPHAHGFADLIGEERRLADGDGWDAACDRITEANQARADERERLISWMRAEAIRLQDAARDSDPHGSAARRVVRNQEELARGLFNAIAHISACHGGDPS